MAKTITERDNSYFLKVLLYFLLGLIWLQYKGHTLLPLGLLLGLLFARHEHFQIDRKLEYVILIIAAFLALHGQGLFFNLT